MLTLVKYLIYDKCLDVMFNQIYRNMLTHHNFSRVGNSYRTIYYYNLQYKNCIIINPSELSCYEDLMPSDQQDIGIAFLYETLIYGSDGYYDTPDEEYFYIEQISRVTFSND